MNGVAEPARATKLPPITLGPCARATGMTQEQFAEMLGVPAGTLRN
jgi:DNA-binding transcriptional regulator YiaG